MKTKHNLKLTLGVLACGCALLNARVSSALNVDYHVNVTTAALIGNPSAPFSLDFQLNDGSGTGDGNNSAMITSFNFGGGAATGTGSAFGGASGDLGSAILLTDNTPFNEFFQGFTPGSTLQFDVFLSQNADAGLTPDEFSFAILDQNLANIATSLPGDSLFKVDISTVPVVQTGTSTSIPGVTAAAHVPDAPSQATLVFAALGLAGAGRCLRKKQDAA